MSTEKKSEGLAAVLSVIFPGLGQIYDGQIGRGLAFMVFGFISAFLILFFIGLIIYPLFWLYNIYDAYSIAKRINQQIMQPYSIANRIDQQIMQQQQQARQQLNLPPASMCPNYQQATTAQPTVKEIIKEREIAKVPCPYCNQLVDITCSKCPNCGAPTN